MEINVLALRKKMGLSREEFAEAIGADPVTIWRWEAGQEPRGLYAKALKELADKAKRTARQ